MSIIAKYDTTISQSQQQMCQNSSRKPHAFENKAKKKKKKNLKVKNYSTDSHSLQSLLSQRMMSLKNCGFGISRIKVQTSKWRAPLNQGLSIIFVVFSVLPAVPEFSVPQKFSSGYLTHVHGFNNHCYIDSHNYVSLSQTSHLNSRHMHANQHFILDVQMSERYLRSLYLTIHPNPLLQMSTSNVIIIHSSFYK